MLFNTKLTVPLILCAFVASSFATPLPKYSSDADANSLLPTDVNNFFKNPSTTELDKSLKNFVTSAEWMVKALGQILRTIADEGILNVFTWGLDLLMRVELFMMADGSHYMFPVSEKVELDQEYKMVSIAVSKLYRNLKTMERVDQVMTNATRSLFTGDSELHLKETKGSVEKVFKTLLHEYIKVLDYLFEMDAELSAEYNRQKSKAKEVVKGDPKMGVPFVKSWEQPRPVIDMKMLESFLQDKMVLRQAVPNKKFLKQSVKHLSMIFSPTHHKRFLLARALLQKAKSESYESKLNELYRGALTQAGEVDVNKESEEVFFETLEKAVEQEPSLYAEIQAIEKKVDASTVYDSSMLHVDFSFL